ncbi:class I SAM-dependent methyltransferase [Promicromonospora sp. NPDC060271]|uniref:class I SAM-dependent methyltransferase n=1 Tax=Promicromonospora sp. NPDC060271 TaxID=3347089 RepID=UPI003668892D
MPAEPIVLTTHEAHVSAKNEVVYEISVSHYQERAEERYAGNDQWLKPIISALGFAPGARAVDVGCAVGTNSLYLANQGYSVTGIDSSPLMISAARAAARNSGLTNRPRFVRQDFCTWVPVEEHERLFDLVLATAFVHLFPAPLDRDITDALLSHVAPGGAAIISTTVEPLHSQALRSKHDDDDPGPGPGQPLSQVRWRNNYTRETFRNLVERVAASRFGPTFTMAEHTSLDPARSQKQWSDIVVTRPF